jgi:hypothetical protein
MDSLHAFCALWKAGDWRLMPPPGPILHPRGAGVREVRNAVRAHALRGLNGGAPPAAGVGRGPARVAGRPTAGQSRAADVEARMRHTLLIVDNTGLPVPADQIDRLLQPSSD